MKNIIKTLMSHPDFSTLVTGIKTAELVDTLSGTGPFTILAPTNNAFAEIPKTTLDDILADKVKLKSILTYHVLIGKVMRKDLVTMITTKTLEGSEVEINVHSDVMVTEIETPDMSEVNIDEFRHILINHATVTEADLQCSNGVIHSIDTVLMPEIQTNKS